MTEEEWLVTRDPGHMLLRCEHTWASDRKRRLFAVGCCRRIELFMSESGQQAVEAAEAFADGKISEQELDHAWACVGHPREHRVMHATDAARATSRVHEGTYPTYAPGSASVSAANALADSLFTGSERRDRECAAQAALVRDIFGNPFRPVSFSPSWRTDTAVSLARQMYDARDFGAMPILADALQDAGCDSDDILSHCRDATLTHVRGCWVVDLVLGKE